MTVRYRLLVLLMAFFLFLSGSSASADYTEWKDSTYDFTKVKTLYIGEMDTSAFPEMGSAMKWKLKEEFYKKTSGVKGLSLLMEQPGPRGRAALPAQEEDSIIEGSETAVPEEAVSGKADIYILPRLEQYSVNSYLLPAHTEWRSREVREGWRDRDGRWHEFYRTVTYPEYVPDLWVPCARVDVTFEWYDVKTGNLVASSEDSRVRNGENNPLSLYRRAIDRFTKNMKKTVKQ